MDIDNLAREFFQNNAVTEHVDGMHFETKMEAVPIILTTADSIHNIESEILESNNGVDPEIIATFWAVEKVFFCLFVSACYVLTLQFYFCGLGDLWSSSNSY
jgi:hypothetical protein